MRAISGAISDNVHYVKLGVCFSTLFVDKRAGEGRFSS